MPNMSPCDENQQNGGEDQPRGQQNQIRHVHFGGVEARSPGPTPTPAPSENAAEEFVPAVDNYEENPINVRPDIGLSDQELVTQSTKALNKLLKKKGISKDRAKEIKQERRTLKNRGYAANCRVKREEEEDQIKADIEVLKAKKAKLSEEIAQNGFEMDYYEKGNEELRRKLAVMDKEDQAEEAKMKLASLMSRQGNELEIEKVQEDTEKSPSND